MSRQNWTEEENEKLKYMYPYLSNEHLTYVFNRSINSIQHRATRLGIHKDPSALKSIKSIARSGFRGANWNGGRKKNKKGHVLVLAKGHPYAEKNGYILEHRLVMCEYLGRGLYPNEVVHHKNGRKDDNRIENLEVMDRGEHSRLHGKEKKQSRETIEKIKEAKRRRRNEQRNSNG